MRLLFFTAALLLFTREARARTCACVATSDGDTLNIRACATTECEIYGAEPPGSCLDYLGDAGNGWFQLQYGAQVGYANGGYMSGPQECADGGADCYGTLCSSNAANEFRTCDAYGCGNYGASRGSRDHTGVDVKCDAGGTVYAPIQGTLSYSYPYGDGTCCDLGFTISGTGAWADQLVKVFYNTPNSNLIGTEVNQGDPIATHIGLSCGDCYDTTMTDHSHIQTDMFGARVDSSSWLTC